MKFILLLSLFFSSVALCQDICQFQETSDFKTALKKDKVKPVRVSKDHTKFTSVEKQLIHKTVTGQSWKRGTSAEESLIEFGDYFDGKLGANRGEIEYYNFEGRQYILVHYWPGDTEYGAYFLINKNGSFKRIAEINDSFITCK